VDFVPGEAGEKKDTQPLRYVGLRLLKPQGVLFADGSDRHHHAVVTNLDWSGARLLQWHREKAGMVVHVHDEVQNGLDGGHLPSAHFNVNAAWFKLALMAYNVVSAIRRLALAPEERTVRLKKFRLLVVRLGGRMSRFQCTMRLRFCATQEAIARVLRIWEAFPLPTQATAFRAASVSALGPHTISRAVRPLTGVADGLCRGREKPTKTLRHGVLTTRKGARHRHLGRPAPSDRSPRRAVPRPAGLPADLGHINQSD
jgi:hypothetical protein